MISPLRSLGRLLPILGLSLGLLGFRWEHSDPEGDDTGPGTYEYPLNGDIRRGTFDIVQLALSTEGSDLVVEATFAAPLPEIAVHLSQDRVVQVHPLAVDIYIDRDGLEGTGLNRTIPGRKVVLPRRRGWEVALLMVDEPYEVRSRLAMGDAELAKTVLVSSQGRVKGRTWTLRFPLDEVGPPRPTWTLYVAVAGALFQSSFELVQRLRSDTLPNTITLEVARKATKHAFGGCDPCGGHPRVVDILVPQGKSQKDILSRYSGDRPAVLPPLSLGGLPAAPPPSPAPPPQPRTPAKAPATLPPGHFAVLDLSPPHLSLSLPPEHGLAKGTFLELADGQGHPQGRLVITHVMDGIAIGTILEARKPLTPPLTARPSGKASESSPD